MYLQVYAKLKQSAIRLVSASCIIIYIIFNHPKDGTALNLNDNKVAGVKLGRPCGVGKSKLDEYKEEIIALLKNGSSKKFVANRYGTSQVNLYNWIKKNNLDVSSQKACV
jgi:DNA invertase Pin-like site-specific DNA recombinase